MKTFTSDEIKDSIQTFDDLVSDLAQADDPNTFENAFSQFIHHCLDNPVMKTICDPLQSYPGVDLKSWLAAIQKTGGSFIGSKRYKLPTDANQRLALIFQFVMAVFRGEVDLLGFCLDVFGVTRTEEMIGKFQQAFLVPLTRELDRRLQESLKKTGSVDLTEEQLQTFVINQHISVGTAAVVQVTAAPGTTQIANASGPAQELAQIFDQLSKVIETHADISSKNEAKDNLKIVETVAKSAHPSVSKIRPFLDTLVSIAGAAELVGKIYEAAKTLGWPS